MTFSSESCEPHMPMWGVRKKFRGDAHITVTAVKQTSWSGRVKTKSETGERRVLGIPIPQTLMIGAYPSHITLAIWVRVRVIGDAHITRVLGMGMLKTRRCLYHCDTAPALLTNTKRRIELQSTSIFDFFILS